MPIPKKRSDKPAFKRADKAKTGRPSLLNDHVMDKVLKLLRAGNYLEVALAIEGVHRDTGFGWLRQGRKDRAANLDTIHARFSIAVEAAAAEGEARDVTLIAKAAEKDWRAAAWRLERKAGKRWRSQSVVALEGSGGPPVRSTLTVSKGKTQHFDDSAYPPSKDPPRRKRDEDEESL